MSIGSMVFTSINLKVMEDAVTEWVVKNYLDGDEELWDDNGWGYYDGAIVSWDDEEIFDGLNLDRLQIDVKRNHPSFKKIIELSEDSVEAYFDEDGKEITREVWISKIDSTPDCYISFCDCGPDG